MRATFVAAAVIVAVASLAACGGDSKEDQAKAQVCDARADIGKQVDALKGVTITTATTSQIQDNLKAIGDDLTKIKNARGDLDDDRKSQVDQANQAFESEVKGVVSTLGSTTSAADAKAKAQQAFQQLADSYKQAFAKIDCS